MCTSLAGGTDSGPPRSTGRRRAPWACVRGPVQGPAMPAFRDFNFKLLVEEEILAARSVDCS
ncbi:hypothetical protein ACFV8E_06285 [Streptomyces sp. NPDC059849]|uniref:hypothetical protein n=1 Tax=Streptomyces sp. NPDC059849 TaxID=3346969 RepID=UPI00365CE5BD